MKLTISLVADFAYVDTATNKLYILGTFTNINVAHFPTVHRRLVVVIQIKPELGDHAEEHNMRVLMTDPDGTDLVQFTTPFQLPYAQIGPRPSYNMIVELNNLPFPGPGTYQFTVDVDDDELGVIPIEVVNKQQSE